MHYTLAVRRPGGALRVRRAPGLRETLISAGKLLLLVVMALAGSPSPRTAPAPELEVGFAGCDVVLRSDGNAACKVTGASIFDGAAHGPQGAGERRLTLWAHATPGAKVWVAIDHRPVLPPPRRIGERMEVAIYRGASELTVTAELEGRATVFHLPITGEPLPEQAQLDEAMALRKERRPEATKRALAILEPLAGTGSPAARAKAIGQQARIAMRRDMNKGIALLREAMDEDRRAGLVSDEVADAFVLVALSVDQRRDLDEASRTLERIDPLLPLFPVGRAMAPDYRALLVSAYGALGAAARLRRTSEERSADLDLAGHLADVYENEMEDLDLLGRHDEAEAVARRLAGLDSPRTDACVVAQREVDLGLHALRAGGAALVTARTGLEKALELFADAPSPATPRCTDAFARRLVLALLTQLALDTGDAEQAGVYLDRARSEVAGVPARFAPAWSILEGRRALLLGAPDQALPRFEEAERLAQDGGLVDLAITAGMGRGDALEELVREDDADDAYTAADERLTAWSTLIALGEGKGTFLEQHEDGVRRHLAHLLERVRRGGPSAAPAARQAACVARRSRARLALAAEWSWRMASSPEQRAAWSAAKERHEEARAALGQDVERVVATYRGESREVRLAELRSRGVEIARTLDEAATAIAGSPPSPSCDRNAPGGLPGPAAGEVILVYHPLPEGWAGFALAPDGEVVAKAVQVEPEDRTRPADLRLRDRLHAAQAERLLAPFADVIAAAREVRIIAAAPLDAIDFQELPFAGRPLGDRSVTYGVDLPRRVALAGHDAATPRRALVVTPEPQARDDDLPRALAEARSVVGDLERADFDVVLLAGAEATRAKVLDALARPGVELFHYAGHAFAEGKDGWEGRLSLARGQWLGLADVMKLSRVPRMITLSSCEAARSSRDAEAEGLALAQAFVVAGAEVVVASTRATDDVLTNEIMTRLYAHHLPRYLVDAAAALHDATDAVRAEPAMAGVPDLPSLRVLVR